MSIPFYRAFEDRYRGSRELIHERQQVYVPFLKPLKKLYPECKALDLGCGRGEWLEILTQTGFKPLGVDLDTGMLEACHALGLPVEEGDALQALKKLPDESLTVVSGFHIAEHIPFEDLKILVAEALRVLKPAGLLILETPNAENLVVGTQNFYLDPTHERPIPHLLLSFLTEFTGFGRCQTLRLQESVELAEGGPVDLLSVLHGVSPDYAVIAQKHASPEQMAAFDPVFHREYGLSLQTLARRYDEQLSGWVEQNNATSTELREQLNQVQRQAEYLETAVRGLDEDDSLETQIREVMLRTELAESRFQNVQLSQDAAQQRARETELRLSQAIAALQHVESQLEQLTSAATQSAQDQMQELTARLNESLSNAHHWWLKANAYEAQLAALENSKSWRITQPLRTSMSLANGTTRLPKRAMRSILARSIRFVLNRPGLRLRFSNKLKSHPRLLERVRTFALHHGLIQPRPEEVSPVTAATEASEDGFLTASPRVARTYSELKLAFERKENR